MFRLREICGERQDRQDVHPPGDREDEARDVAREDRSEDRVGDRRRAVAPLEEARRKAGALEHQERDHEQRDHAEDHVPVERDVHPGRREEAATDQGDGDRGEHEDGEDVDGPREERAPRTRHVKAEDAVDEQIDRTDRDHEESPEDERMGQPADVVRPFQQLALAEIDHELVANTTPGVVDTRLVASESHVPVQAPRAPEECAEAEHCEHQQNCAADHEPAGRGYHARFTL